MPYHENHPLHTEVLKLTCGLLKKKMYEKLADFRIKAFVTPEPVAYENRLNGEYKEFYAGDIWGKLWDCAWFEMSAVCPKDKAGRKLFAKIDLSGEALLFDKTGCPVKGFTSVKSRMTYTLGMMGKTVFPLDCKAGDEVLLTIDAANNDLFGGYQGGTIVEAGIYACNEEIRNLYYDFAVLCELMLECPEDKVFHHKIKRALTTVEKMLTDYSEKEAAECRKVLAPLLAVRSADTGFDISVLGHAHLDLAWTWPIRETIRKGARTFSTALFNMSKYPFYKFGASQAQLYAWMEDRYPQLFKKVQGAAQTGRWEIQGGMWVECDLNVPCGESLVRQFLFGQEYFTKKFGKPSNVCWLADSFGYTGNLPQLIKSAGMNRMMTQKIRTSPHRIEYPHDTFMWKGIDGSKVLLHVPPFENYGSSGSPREVSVCEKRFKDKLDNPSCLLLVGQGDGGGGAGFEVLEALDREKNLEGLAKTVSRTAEEFFDLIEKGRNSFPEWNGSMDLDMHTGTLTSSADSKKFNKLAEIKLHTLEWLNTIVKTCEKRRLDEIWKAVLLYQFHDILTGTSIKRVFDENRKHYREMLAELDGYIETAKNKIAGGFCLRKEEALVFNPSPVHIKERIGYGEKTIEADVEPYGIKKFALKHYENPDLKCGPGLLENAEIRVQFNKDGSIASVTDKKTGFEYIKEYGNRLCLYADRLNYNEDWGIENAWDFPIRYADKTPWIPKLVKSKNYIENNRAIIENTFSINQSVIIQKNIIAGGGRIDFETCVDWKESERMLRSVTDTTVVSPYASRGIQFGKVLQKTNKNTMWEYAVNESPAQRYVDITQGNAGIALLSPHKYGYRLNEGQLNVCLLRSSNYPAEKLDEGEHNFVYSLYFHRGTAEGKVLDEAYKLEYPLEFLTKECSGKAESLCRFSLKNRSVIIETVKVAEDGCGIIIRLYEPDGSGAAESLLIIGMKSAAETNILEQGQKVLTVRNETVELNFRPFEIKTLRIVAG